MAGKGRPGWLPVIEDGHTLDLADLRRQGLLRLDGVARSSNLQWRAGISQKPTLEAVVTCFVTSEYGWMELRYKLPNRDGSSIEMHERIYLLPRPQRYGGYRVLAKCPSSGRACRCLYLLNGASKFRSRHGFQTKPQYRSQGLALHSRLLQRRNSSAEKLLNRLHPAVRDAIDGSDVPPRPKGMHVKTYMSLAARWRLHNQMADVAFERWQEKNWGQSGGPSASEMEGLYADTVRTQNN